MGKAALCVPYDFTATSVGAAAAGTSINFISNDEPGLVFRSTTNILDITLDLGSQKPVRFAALLGLVPKSYQIQVVLSNSSDLSNPIHINMYRSNFSASRTGPDMKFLAILPEGLSARYVGFRVAAGQVNPSDLNIWRALVGSIIQPEENIETGAEEGIDDRSNRRYARNGRRVIDPTVIVPTMQGSWEYLSPNEYQAFRSWGRLYGATRPSMLVMDTEQDSINPFGGEDGMYFGDFEKSFKLTLDEGYYKFSFAVVNIAP